MDKDIEDREEKEGVDMANTALVKKNGLTPEKKEGLRQLMGKFSGKASLSIIREIRKNENN